MDGSGGYTALLSCAVAALVVAGLIEAAVALRRPGRPGAVMARGG